MENILKIFSPIDNKLIAKVAKSNRKDIDLAVEAGWEAFKSWGKASAIERSNVLNKIADILEKNLEKLAIVESWDNGKPIRETINADIPLSIDHFRYLQSVIRAESGSITDLDSNTVSMEIHEALGVCQIIPWTSTTYGVGNSPEFELGIGILKGLRNRLPVSLWV